MLGGQRTHIITSDVSSKQQNRVHNGHSTYGDEQMQEDGGQGRK